MHIFVDESGSFQSHDPNGVIVFAAIVTNDADRLRRVIRRSRRAKLRTKKEKKHSEIKGTSATDKFKAYFYRQLSKADFEIFLAFLRMKDIRTDHWKQKAGVLRLKLITQLLETTGAIEHERVEVVLDRQPLPGLSAHGFRIAIEARFGGTLAKPKRFNAYFKDSQEDLGIQVADFIAHDTALKYTQGNTRWYMLFHDHIKSEMNGADII